MNTVSFLLFENPITLWVVLGVIEIAALAVWQRTRSRRAVKVLVAMPAIAVAVGILSAAVATDYESVLRTIGAMDRAVVTGNADAFLAEVSSDYGSGAGDKAALAAAVRLGLASVRAAPSAAVLRRETTPEGEPRFRATQDYRLRPAPGSEMPIPPEWQCVTWEGEFRRDADGRWRLIAAVSVHPERLRAEEAVTRALRAWRHP